MDTAQLRVNLGVGVHCALVDTSGKEGYSYAIPTGKCRGASNRQVRRVRVQDNSTDTYFSTLLKNTLNLTSNGVPIVLHFKQNYLKIGAIIISFAAKD